MELKGNVFSLLSGALVFDVLSCFLSEAYGGNYSEEADSDLPFVPDESRQIKLSAILMFEK